MPVYKQPNSKYWLIEFWFDGKRYRRSSGTSIKRTAEQIENKWRQEIHQGTHQIAKTDILTVKEATRRYWDTIISIKPSRERSKRSELCTLNNICAWFGPHTRLDRIRANDLSTWRDTMLAEKKEPATVNRYLATFRAILNRAYSDWGAISTVPKVRLHPLNNIRRRCLSREDEGCVLEACAPHLRSLTIFLVDTGARLSEALDVTWRDVEIDGFVRPSVMLTRTKNKHPRRIPLTIRLQNLLREIRPENAALTDKVFLYRQPRSAAPGSWSADAIISQSYWYKISVRPHLPHRHQAETRHERGVEGLARRSEASGAGLHRRRRVGTGRVGGNRRQRRQVLICRPFFGDRMGAITRSRRRSRPLQRGRGRRRPRGRAVRPTAACARRLPAPRAKGWRRGS